jgi:hypothetical protein
MEYTLSKTPKKHDIELNLVNPMLRADFIKSLISCASECCAEAAGAGEAAAASVEEAAGESLASTGSFSFFFLIIV